MKRLLLIACWFATHGCLSQDSGLDVLNYELRLVPDLHSGEIQGEVKMGYKVSIGTQFIELDKGELEIVSVIGANVISYFCKGSKITVQLAKYLPGTQHIKISYQGKPRRGLLFNTSMNEAHTVYFTDHWMVCNYVSSDRATFSIDLLLPKELTCVASGERLDSIPEGSRTLHRWKQDYETPPYTYGFVIGSFNQAEEEVNGITYRYLSSKFEAPTLIRVFKETPDMISFFEQKSGLPYYQTTYSQIVIGDNYQEMSGLAIFNKSYPEAVLKDSSEIHLTAHELAHQWWGNRITCKNFGHFWLNEALAVYMASAYNEFRFGSEKYESDMTLYKNIYDALIERGADKPLVFKNWESNRDNRHVVYYKGAYVLHLLRRYIGDTAFWKGLQVYSRKYDGCSVETSDFREAMENASGLELSSFFKKWVYAIP